MLDLPLHPRLARMVVAADPADKWLACVLAAVVDERDPFRSGPGQHPPADLALRVDAVTGRGGHDGREKGRGAASDQGGRSGQANRFPQIPDLAPSERSGAVLALAYPDRLAIRRGSPAASSFAPVPPPSWRRRILWPARDS